MVPADKFVESAIAAAVALFLAVASLAAVLVVSDCLGLSARFRAHHERAPSARSSLQVNDARFRPQEIDARPLPRKGAWSPVTPMKDAAAAVEKDFRDDEHALVRQEAGPKAQRELRVSFEESMRGAIEQRAAAGRVRTHMLADSREAPFRAGRADAAGSKVASNLPERFGLGKRQALS